MAKNPLYWEPTETLHSAYALRHAAPQLVGRLPRVKAFRANGYKAAAKLNKLPKLKSPASISNSSLTPQSPSPTPLAQPPVLRMGPPITGGPPAGNQMPQLAKAPPLAAKQPVQLGS